MLVDSQDLGNCDLGVWPVLLSGDIPAWKATLILNSVGALSAALIQYEFRS
jgi:hypothetical protein